MNFTYESNRIVYFDPDGTVLAEVTFPSVDADTVNIDHTFVDDSLRGQGVAGTLVKAAADQLRKDGKKAILTCPYAIQWFGKHPEYSDLLE